jgi:hypothetical protein
MLNAFLSSVVILPNVLANLLNVRHFAEGAASFLSSHSLLSAISGWHARCIHLVRRCSKKKIDETVSQKENAMTTLCDRSQAAAPVTNRHRYARLCQAVIFRAVKDLGQKQYRGEARKWLLSPESDYAFATAGISPESIRLQMI